MKKLLTPSEVPPDFVAVLRVTALGVVRVTILVATWTAVLNCNLYIN